VTIVNGGVMPEACVLAIGKFEGMHLGHQALLTQVTQQAGLLELASAAMVFDPHPYIFFNDPGYKPLFTNDERNHLLDVDYLYYCHFDKNFAALSAQDFCKFLFVDCKAKLVIVGENYRFGKGRMGDTTFLQNEAIHYGAKVQILPTKNINNDIISTSNIRNLIAKGKLKEARQLLGFPFFAIGVIENNVLQLPDDKFLPPAGVYITNTTLDGKQVKIEFLEFAGILQTKPSGE